LESGSRQKAGPEKKGGSKGSSGAISKHEEKTKRGKGGEPAASGLLVLGADGILGRGGALGVRPGVMARKRLTE